MIFYRFFLHSTIQNLAVLDRYRITPKRAT